MTANHHRLQRPIHLVLDFDATLTVRDTIALLPEVPLHRDRRLGEEAAFPVRGWSALENAYMEDYERHKKTEVANANERRGNQIGSIFDQVRRYSQMLARRRELEERSMKRLQQWNFFRGVTRADVTKAAEALVEDGRLEMRQDWSEMLKMFLPSSRLDDVAKKSKMSIISLNWSRTFIRQSLLSALKAESLDCSDLTRFIMEDLDIYACEIVGLDDTNGSSGQMQADILSSADKLKYLPPASQRSDLLQAGRQLDGAAPYLVYIGDSSTDFDCLMAADAGIWLYPVDDPEKAREKCMQCFRPLQLEVRPIGELHQTDTGDDELIWAQNFKQITQYLSMLVP